MALNLFEGVRSMFRMSGSTYDAARANVAMAAGTELPASERYAIQRAYYANNGLYEDLARHLYRFDSDAIHRAIRGLRNPAFRVVEFYPSLLWPGRLPEALPIIPDETNSAIIEPIHTIWKWSNWSRKKDVFARYLPMLGDTFIEVARNDERDRVFLHLIEPEHVTDFEVDERGYITWLRIDVQIQIGRGRDATYPWETREWDKFTQLYRRWHHEQGPLVEIEDLGTPVEITPFSAMGIDFVPIVYTPFREIGEKRASGAFTLAIDKIDHLNAEATRLSQMLYRHGGPTMALVGGRDSDGRELPPPVVINNTSTGRMERRSDDIISVGGDTKIASLVPNINWDAHLNVIQAGLSDLEDDLPELAWWRVRDFGRSNDVSGRALNYILAPAIKRLLEARGNGEEGMVRAMQMALTVGKNGTPDLFPSVPLGTFEQGDFEHRFEEREVVPISDLEKAETDRGRGLAAQAWRESGLPMEDILRRNNYAEDEIVEILARMEAEQAATLEREADMLERQAAFSQTDDGGEEEE